MKIQSVYGNNTVVPGSVVEVDGQTTGTNPPLTNATTPVGVFRPSNGNWYLDYNKTGTVDRAFHFGTAGDSPIGGSTIPKSQPLQVSTTITFTPDLTIVPGTTVYIMVGVKVIWKNEDPLKPHGIAAVDSHGAKYFGGLTGFLIPFNKTYEVIFDTPGYFSYKTTFQPETTGTVVVTK